MGVDIIEDRENKGACFYCTTSNWAFGPVFRDRESAERFQQFLSYDPRKFSEKELQIQYNRWYSQTHCVNCHELILEFEDSTYLQEDRGFIHTTNKIGIEQKSCLAYYNDFIHNRRRPKYEQSR